MKSWQAKEILNSEDFQGLIDVMSRRLHDLWESSDPFNEQENKHLKLKLDALNSIVRELRSIVDASRIEGGR